MPAIGFYDFHYGFLEFEKHAHPESGPPTRTAAQKTRVFGRALNMVFGVLFVGQLSQ
jgi:hypothetical protein